MRYCVYFHRRKDNNRLFYIGQGTEKRPYCSTRKLKAWNEVVKEAGGFIVEIVKSGLSKDEALDLEDELIFENSDIVVNKLTSSSRTKHLDFEEFDNKYYIDESSPSGLRYKVDIYAGVNYCSKMKNKDDPAGIIDNSGYWSITHNLKPVKVHRIIYLLSNGCVDSSKVVDHIDGNPLNNSVANLRLIDHSQNRRNLCMDKRNTTGFNGVAYGCSKNNYRASYVNLDGSRIERSFSVSKYGEDEALRLAIAWRKQMIDELNQQSAGYTERHGT